MLSIYVAAASLEIDRARKVVAALESAARTLPIEVVSTWIDAIDTAGTANEGLSPIARKEAARTCLRELSEADILLLLVPHNDSGIGCGVELGYVLALRDEWPLRSPRIIAAGRTDRTIFAALADEEHGSDEDAIAAVVRMAGEAAG